MKFDRQVIFRIPGSCEEVMSTLRNKMTFVDNLPELMGGDYIDHDLKASQIGDGRIKCMLIRELNSVDVIKPFGFLYLAEHEGNTLIAARIRTHWVFKLVISCAIAFWSFLMICFLADLKILAESNSMIVAVTLIILLLLGKHYYEINLLRLSIIKTIGEDQVA
ncbi:hypothetical protein [Sanyastnella coralliicola]|uniref:hypothetical protein n=1 Tax=Sanyastnella coralliicola TaxID=3069118 RepID=UPI0027B99A40|nr:hypothetical protein [Longitalea sp. SCSIO 12813]